MIPSEPASSTVSDAERMLFKRLRLIDDGWRYGLHSLNLASHQYKLVGEIDFLLVGDACVLVLEVKGGVVECRRGVWTFTDRFGVAHRRREGPFKQAQSAMYSLRGTVERRLPDLAPSIPFGFGVVFPDCEFDIRSVEWDQNMIVDSRTLQRPNGMVRGLRVLNAYWREKQSSGSDRWDSAAQDRLVRELRPDFDCLPTLSQLARRADDELVPLTEMQYKALDQMGLNNRVMYHGGAGSGKTLLACEAARRAAVRGDSVLFTCRSPLLAEAVRPGLETSGVDVRVHGTGSARPEPYDVLIIDEGQDVLTAPDLATLDGFLGGGLGGGRWLMFLDLNAQADIYQPRDHSAEQRLRGYSAQFRLTDNCRNTAQIVGSAQELTGADVGVSTAGSGPDVSLHDPTSRHEMTDALAGILMGLDDQDVDPADVVLCSPLNFEASSFGLLPRALRTRIVPWKVADLTHPPSNKWRFATIEDFKGLESRFIVLADVLTKGETRDRAHLYVGVTRARASLTVLTADRLVT